MVSVPKLDWNYQRNAQIRAGFTLQGTSLCAWCRLNGINPQNARKAIVGKWTGPKAQLLIEQIESAAKIAR
jgi:lambda repressor-like predicted transcriptional regulator